MFLFFRFQQLERYSSQAELESLKVMLIFFLTDIYYKHIKGKLLKENVLYNTTNLTT